MEIEELIELYKSKMDGLDDKDNTYYKSMENRVKYLDDYINGRLNKNEGHKPGDD